jgi:hypothetical protein
VRHPFFQTSRALVFAHRGGAALAPENTIAAFDRGLETGADGIELDVRCRATASSSCTMTPRSIGRLTATAP